MKENKYFAQEKVNSGRQPELDLLKFLCIVGMIIVHAVLDLGEQGFGDMDALLTEFFGAATFMICMGVGMQYAHNQTPGAYAARGFAILTMGQFLNIIRNSLPCLVLYWITDEQFFIANALLVLQSDILTFAGLAFLLMALLKKFKLSDLGILIVGLVLNIAAFILCYTVESPENYLVSQFLAFFIVTKAEAYFPLFAYFIFVAFGYYIGGYYPRIKDKDAVANRAMLICFPIVAVFYVFRITNIGMGWLPELGSDLSYNLRATPDAIMNCLFTVGILAVLYKFIKHVFKGKCPKLVLQFSENINTYYCLSYMFILPLQYILIATTGELIESFLVTFLYGILVCVICYFLIEMNNKHWNLHITNLKGWKQVAFVVLVWAATVAICMLIRGSKYSRISGMTTS